MPAFTYETPLHDDIIKTWIDFGIIKQKTPGDDYAASNLERIDNRGIAVLLPIIPIEELSFENKKDIIQLGVDVVRFFKSEGFLLPIENTAPHCLITTLSPTDSLIPVYESIGFELLNKPGYKEFSPGKKRIVLYKSL